MAIKGINEALESNDPKVTLKALENPHGQLPHIMSYAAPLYHDEFKNIKAEKQVNKQTFSQNNMPIVRKKENKLSMIL